VHQSGSAFKLLLACGARAGDRRVHGALPRRAQRARRDTGLAGTVLPEQLEATRAGSAGGLRTRTTAPLSWIRGFSPLAARLRQ
jgi:hypothetical protein